MSSSGNDTIGMAPPPRRLPDTSALAKPPEETVELSATKEPPRPPEVDATSAEAAKPADPPPATARPSAQPAKKAASRKRSAASKPASASSKTTLHLPSLIRRRLKAWTSTHRRTTADAVMSAYIQCHDEVASDFETTADDKQRVEFGLQPLAAVANTAENDDGTRVVGLYIKPNALSALDAASEGLGISRSRYAGALLDKFLPPHTSN